MKKLVVATTLLTLFASCGKHELIGKAKKEVNDFSNATGKAILDTVSTGFKAVDDTFKEVDRSADSIITKTNDAKNAVLSNTGNFGEDIASGAEALAQAPKNSVNQLLGIDEKTDEELRDLERDVDELYQEMLESFADIRIDIDATKFMIRDVNSDLQESKDEINQNIEDVHTELADEIARGDRKNLRKIRNIRSKISQVKSDLRLLENVVDGLEVECQQFRFTPFITSCELVQNSRR